MVPAVMAGNILGEATTPSGNIFNEAMRGDTDSSLEPRCFYGKKPITLDIAQHSAYGQYGS
jgi:hypothetical protein